MLGAFSFALGAFADMSRVGSQRTVGAAAFFNLLPRVQHTSGATRLGCNTCAACDITSASALFTKTIFGHLRVGSPTYSPPHAGLAQASGGRAFGYAKQLDRGLTARAGTYW